MRRIERLVIEPIVIESQSAELLLHLDDTHRKCQRWLVPRLSAALDTIEQKVNQWRSALADALERDCSRVSALGRYPARSWQPTSVLDAIIEIVPVHRMLS